jgi:large subunit ribosomal protein L29
MKTFEIKDLSDSELVKRIADDKESLAHMKFQQATKQIENTAKLRLIRRDIARMMTMLNQRKRKGAATKP